MYKVYKTPDYLKVADECTERIRSILQSRYNEIEEFRHAVNDRYPFEDLFLRWAEIDNERELVRQLLSHLELCSAALKEKIREEYAKYDSYPSSNPNPVLLTEPVGDGVKPQIP